MVVTISRDAASLLNTSLNNIISKNNDASRQIANAISGLNSCFRSSGVKSPVSTLNSLNTTLKSTNQHATALRSGVSKAVSVLYDADKSCAKSYSGFGDVSTIFNGVNRVITRHKTIRDIAHDKLKNIRELFKNTARTVKTAKSEAKKVVKNWFSKISNGAKDLYNKAKKSYDEGGWVYGAVRAVKSTCRLVTGVASVAAAVASIVATGGAAAVPATLAIVYGANKIASATADIWTIGTTADTKKLKEKEETNFLKSACEGAGGALGNVFGDEELGKKIGEEIYNVGDLTNTVFSLDSAIDKFASAESVGEHIKYAYKTTEKVFGDAVSVITNVADGKFAFDGLLGKSEKVIESKIAITIDVAEDVANYVKNRFLGVSYST